MTVTSIISTNEEENNVKKDSSNNLSGEFRPFNGVGPDGKVHIQRLSFSQVGLFQSCPAKWAFEKLYEVHEESQTGPLVKGRNVHTEIESILKGNQVNNPYHETNVAMEMLSWFRNGEIKPEDIEIDSGDKLIPETEDLVMHGKIDLRHNGFVFDWKTSAKGWKPGAEKYKKQGTLYQWLFDMPVRFVILEPAPKGAELENIRDVSYTEQQTQRYFKTVRSVRTQMESSIYPRRPSFSCNECPARNQCKPWIHGKESVTAPRSTNGHHPHEVSELQTVAA